MRKESARQKAFNSIVKDYVVAGVDRIDVPLPLSHRDAE